MTSIKHPLKPDFKKTSHYHRSSGALRNTLEKSMHILVINSGSSSIKFRLYDMARGTPILSGKLERIGEAISIGFFRVHTPTGSDKKYTENTQIVDHEAGLKRIFSFLQKHVAIESTTSSSPAVSSIPALQAVGHRVVHGGEKFRDPTVIDDHVIDDIRALIPLAPLHNPANLLGIEAIRKHYPHVPQVAVFDTAFFRDLPARAYRYALPDDLYRQHNLRRYGFHGTSHYYVAHRAADHLQQPITSLRLITLHLGNGASAAAIRDGTCIDTSMGMTPMDGLIMGTRCGDLDPAVHFYLARRLNLNLDEIENLFNKNSGMKGLCGTQDMREVHQLANDGDKQAQLAIEMYCYRICKYIGSYYIILGGLDALIFTAGVGENDALIRQSICTQLAVLGISLDPDKNQSGTPQVTDISGKSSKIKVLVIATDEELEIAQQTVAALKKT